MSNTGVLPADMIPQKKANIKQQLKDRWSGLAPATKKKIYIALGVLVALGLAKVAWNFLAFETTDDAYVTAHIHMISARVAGTVQSVKVDDNQVVHKGDVLVELDPRDYEVQLKIAQANYAKAHQDLGRLSVAVGPDDKPLLDTYTANALVSEAQLENARLQLEYTQVKAPSDGRIGKRSVEEGTRVQPGQPLMAVVENDAWIVANFKETQIPSIHAGQKADVDVDGVPDVTFRGRVDSVAPGSGATFSLLPPDNATGNFTKIVQRVPVKIVLDSEDLKKVGDRLVAGMSATVHVHVH
jgi:membrane fusion protein (multidrug efflux system)